MRTLKRSIPLLQRLRQYLRNTDLLPQGKNWLLGVSGGPDSMALLHLMARLHEEFRWRLEVVCVDHGQRPASGDEADFVRQQCAALEVPCSVEKLTEDEKRPPRGRSVEDWLRECRYEHCRRVAQESRCDGLVLGHHRDDLAETLLLQLLRGSGLDGLSGLRPVSRWNTLALRRPLLPFFRQELCEFLASEGLGFREDESNKMLRFERSRLRHKLIPVLESDFQPAIRQVLARTSEILRDDADLLKHVEGEAFAAATSLPDPPQKTPLLNLSAFAALLPALRLRVLRRWVGAELDHPPAYSKVKALEAFLLAPQPGRCFKLNAQCWIYRDYQVAWRFEAPLDRKASKDEILNAGRGSSPKIPSPKSDQPPPQPPFWLEPNTTPKKLWPADAPGEKECEVDLGNGRRLRVSLGEPPPAKSEMGDNEVWLDAEKIQKFLVLRPRERGDRIPLGKPGDKSAKVKNLMIGKKIPLLQRDIWPLLADAEGVVAVWGLRVSTLATACKETKNALCVRVISSDA
ncbi:MAG: tRNA lysidine(34) synthetase TilS [bacterium]